MIRARVWKSLLTVTALLAAFGASACGSRPEVWEKSLPPLQAYGLEGAVVVLDGETSRAVVLQAHGDQDLTSTAVPLGKNVLTARTSADGRRLFVLTAGDDLRSREGDQTPALTVVEVAADGPHARRFPLAAPLGGLAVDPLGQWVALFPAGSGGFVENPNQILLVDLTKESGADNPTPRTLRSFGGTPKRLTFSPPLHLPGGERRILAVETDQDVALLDLTRLADVPAHPDITVRLTGGTDGRSVAPAALVFDDGDPTRDDDARIGLRSGNDDNVYVLRLEAPAKASTDPAANDFQVTLNLTGVGGVPSDLAFLRTDGGLRLAALVPGTSSAVLVDPDTSITSTVTLPRAFARLSLVTGLVGAADGTTAAPGVDTALLWSGSSAAGVALWSLGRTAGQPYRSVEVLTVAGSVGAVLDVPQPNPQLKLLQASALNAFWVLDLQRRTVSPLTSTSSVTLSLAPTGDRVWAFEQGAQRLARVDLATLHPLPLAADLPVRAVFDVAKRDGSGRSLVALHDGGSLAATVFDAQTPSPTTARRHPGLLLKGLSP